MPHNLGIDKIDRQIISILMEDAKTPYTDIAKKAFVSSGTVHVRMKKLEKMGIVKGSSLIIDPAKMGYDLTAHLGVYLEKGSIYKRVIKELEKIPDSEWLSTTNVTKTISQDILGQIEKTAKSIGFTLEDILQLMAENRFITELRSKKKS